MVSKLIGLSIFFCIIQSSFALKCFICNSNTFKKCNDLSDNTIQTQDCSADIFLKDEQLLDPINYGRRVAIANKDTLIPTCLKVTSNNPTTGDKHVQRLCTFKYQDSQNACAVANVKLDSFKDEKIEFCGTCNDKDGCNNGNQIKLFYSLIVFGAIISSARLFV